MWCCQVPFVSASSPPEKVQVPEHIYPDRHGHKSEPLHTCTVLLAYSKYQHRVKVAGPVVQRDLSRVSCSS